MSDGRPPVYFYVPHLPSVEMLEAMDADRDWAHFQISADNWVTQAYLRLPRAGTAAVRTAPESGIVVTHTSHLTQLLKEAPRRHQLTIVSVRSDKMLPRYEADFEVVQNHTQAMGSWRRIFVPHWPQPGLIRRDEGRGATVATVGYLGDPDNLHPDYTSPDWVACLERQGLRWRCAGGRADGSGTRAWNDYSEVDVVVAVRPRREDLACKPATKLVNAWLAGVPAVLGPEVGYQELRRSDLDYIQVSDAGEAADAVRRLATTPSLYFEMVENGRQRARWFDVPAVTERWLEALALVGIAREHDSQLRRRVRSAVLTSWRRARTLARRTAWRLQP
jgi:hypothetical protein